MKAKLLKLLLAIVCLLCCIGVYAHDFEVGGIYYNKLSSTEVEVTYYGYLSDSYNKYTGAVTIPEVVTYLGATYSVTSIGEHAFRFCTGLTEITIGNSVIMIGERAFAYRTGLTEVTIPNSVSSIGAYAFSGCTGLTTLNFNAEICTYMGSSSYPVFEGCTNLKTLNIGESVKAIPNYAFYGCTGLTEVAIGNSVTSIGESAFEDCTGLIEITIPNSVTSIGESAFEDCTGLTEVAIGNSVTSIANYAFKGCTGLKSLTIEDGDSTLELGYNYYSSSSNGEGLFYDCPIETLYIGRNLSYSTASNYGYSPFARINELKTVTIGNSVTSIGNYAFKGCTGLKSLTIEDGDSTLELGYNYYYGGGEGLFYDCPIETLYIGRNLSYSTTSNYGYSPFARINELKTVTIGNSVTSIEYAAFEDCTGLTEISIPNSVTSIGAYAFSGCTGLTEITIPNSVTSIGDYAFYECTGLTSVTIGNSVTSIGDYAFYECTGLTEIHCHATTPPTINSSTFSTFSYYTATLYVLIQSFQSMKRQTIGSILPSK